MDVLSIPEIFQQTANKYAEHIAIDFMGKKTDFKTVDYLSNNVSAALAGNGINKGDRVALYCINSDAFAIAYLAIIKSGATVVPINLLLTPKEITYLLHNSGAKGLFYHEVFDQSVTAFRDQVSTLNCFICIGSAIPENNDLNFSEIATQPGNAPDVELDPLADLAAILYTSGTTGKPKGAMLTHHNLASNTQSVLETVKMIPGKDVLVAVLPMFHAFASTVCMLTPLLRGLTILPVTKFDPELLANTIEQGGGTILCAVPSMYNVMLNMNEKQVSKLSGLRFCVSGGAAMPEEVMKKFEDKFGILIYEGYGPTECSPVTNVNPIHGIRKTLSVGPSLSHVEVCIKNNEGNDLKNGEIGELCVRGPNVMKGYWNRDEDTKESFFGEWFRTGDLGKRDDDNYFYIVDRIKDLVIVNGMNVYPRIVEEVLYQHPDIAECAVIGQQDNLHGEIVVAYLVTTSGKELSATDMRHFCRDKLGRYQVPKKFHFVDSLPKNATGKIMKRELKAEKTAEPA